MITTTSTETSRLEATPDMSLRLGLYAKQGAFPTLLKASRQSFVRLLTTHNTITDQATGKVVVLSDPSRPELADYPNPKPVLSQYKDPYVKYDDQQNRRNLNEPVNIDGDLYDMWSPEVYDFVPDSTAWKHNAIFFSLVLGFGAAIYVFQLNPEKPAMPRSYPYDGLAKELGSGKKEDDSFYRVSPDLTADENGILTADANVASLRKAYEAENASFIGA